MLYWYSATANKWHVLDHENVIHQYDSGVGLRKDYPNAEYCSPEQQAREAAR